MARQATREEIDQVFTATELFENQQKARALKKGKKMERLGAIIFLAGMVLAVITAFLTSRFFSPIFPITEIKQALLLLSFIPCVVTLFSGAGLIIWFLIPRYHGFPVYIADFLTCPNCLQEHSEKSFNKRTVEIPYD